MLNDGLKSNGLKSNIVVPMRIGLWGWKDFVKLPEEFFSSSYSRNVFIVELKDGS